MTNTFDEAAFRRALAPNIHDPLMSRVVELLWLPPERYAQSIERDGVVFQQKMLADLRANAARIADRLPRLAGEVVALENRSAAARERSFTTRHPRAVSVYEKSAIDHMASAKRLKREISNLKDSVPIYQKAIDRLEAALVRYVACPPTREAEAHVAPPAVAPPTPIQITVALPTDPLPVVVTALPARKTTTEIVRNGAGEIVESHQLEADF